MKSLQIATSHTEEIITQKISSNQECWNVIISLTKSLLSDSVAKQRTNFEEEIKNTPIILKLIVTLFML